MENKTNRNAAKPSPKSGKVKNLKSDILHHNTKAAFKAAFFVSDHLQIKIIVVGYSYSFVIEIRCFV
jgi:hypothetical protein